MRFTSHAFELIRAYYVRKDAEADQVTPVVQRALALREGITPAAMSAGASADEKADHLADINIVVGATERMRTQEVLHGLVQHNPREYRGWGFADLRAVLDRSGRSASPTACPWWTAPSSATHSPTGTPAPHWMPPRSTQSNEDGPGRRGALPNRLPALPPPH